MPNLTAEEYSELKRLTSDPGTKLDDDSRTRALQAVQGFEDQGIQEWGAAGAPGQPGVVEKITPEHDILPQALALQPATTDPGGDEAASSAWMSSGGADAKGTVFVYEPPLNLVKKKLLEDPQFARTLFPNLPPDPAAITKMTPGDSTYQAAADLMWRQTADAAAKSGKTAYRYSKAPWLHDGGAMSGIKQFGMKALGSVKPAAEGIDAFVMGVDDTAAFGAVRGAQEAANPDLKEPNELLGIESVGGTPGGKATERNAAVAAEHPALYGLGQGIGLLAPWGAANQAYELAAKGGSALVAKVGGGVAARLGAAAGGAAVGAGAAQAGHEAVDAASTAARTGGDPGTTLGAAAGRVGASALDPINAGLGVLGEGVGQLASRGAEVVREGPRYGGAPGRFERLGGDIKMGKGPVAGPDVENAIKEGRKLDVHPADVMAKEIAPRVAEAEHQAVAEVKKQVGDENKKFYPTDEGQMLLPADTLQQEVLGVLKSHVAPGKNGLRPLPKSQGAIKEARKLFNGNIAEGGVSLKPVPGAIEITPEEAEAFLNPEFQKKLRPKGAKKPPEPSGGAREVDLGGDVREPPAGGAAGDVREAASGGAAGDVRDPMKSSGRPADELDKPDRMLTREQLAQKIRREQEEGLAADEAASATPIDNLAEEPKFGIDDIRPGKDERAARPTVPKGEGPEGREGAAGARSLEPLREAGPAMRREAAKMDKLRESTANVPEWKEGAGKTYISDLYEQAKGKFKSREEFNDALLKAHRGTKGGLLDRLDLVAAADPKKLSASTVKAGNAEYDLVSTKEAGRLLKEWGIVGAGATLAATQDDEQGEGAAAAGVIGLAKSLKRRGIDKVYVVPRRYNAEQHETLIKTLQHLAEDPQNPAARTAKKLYEAAFVDRDKRPMKGQPGGWSAYQNEHSQRIEKVKRNAELAAPGGDSFQPLVDYSKQRMGQLPLVEAVRSAADRAGVRQQVDRVRSLDPLMSIQDQMAIRKPGARVPQTAMGAASSVFDQANMRFGYPAMRALEGKTGPIRGGTAGRASQIKQDDEKEKRK